MVTSPYECKIFKWDETPQTKTSVHHKIEEYTLQDIEYTTKNYKIYTTGY